MKTQNKIGIMTAMLMTILAAPAWADGEDTAPVSTESPVATEITAAPVESGPSVPATVEPSSDSSSPALGSRQNNNVQQGEILPHKLSKCRGRKPQSAPSSLEELTEELPSAIAQSSSPNLRSGSQQPKCGKPIGQAGPGQSSSQHAASAPEVTTRTEASTTVAPVETPAPSTTSDVAPVEAGTAS